MNNPMKNILVLLLLAFMGATGAWAANDVSVESNWPTTSGYKLGYIQTADGTPIYAEFTYDEETGAYTMHSPLAKGCRYWIEDAEGNRYGMSGNETMTRLNDEISLIEAGLTVEWITYSCDSLSLTVNASGVPVSLKGEGWPVPGIYLFGTPSQYKLSNDFKFAERYGHPGEYICTKTIDATQWIGNYNQFVIRIINEDATYGDYFTPYSSHDESNSTNVPMVLLGSNNPQPQTMFNLPDGYYTIIINSNETTPTITISGWPGYYIHGMASGWHYPNEYKFTEVADNPGVYRLTAEIKEPQYGGSTTSFIISDVKAKPSPTVFYGTQTSNNLYTLTEDNSTNVPLTADAKSFEIEPGTYTFELNTNGDTPSTLTVTGWGGQPSSSKYYLEYNNESFEMTYNPNTGRYEVTLQVESQNPFIIRDENGNGFGSPDTSHNFVISDNSTGLAVVGGDNSYYFKIGATGEFLFSFAITNDGMNLDVIPTSGSWPVERAVYWLNINGSITRMTDNNNGTYTLTANIESGSSIHFERVFREGGSNYGGDPDLGEVTLDANNSKNVALHQWGSDFIMGESGEYTFTVTDGDTPTFTVTGWPNEQKTFYIVGTMTNNYDWVNGMQEMVYNEQNNAYEYVLTVGDAPVYFSIADKILEANDEAHWNDMNANHRYAPAFDYATELTQDNTPIQLQKQKGEMKISAPGTYKLSLSPDLMLSVAWTSTDLVINGDMEGDDVSCFFKREQTGANPDAIVPATFTEGAGKNGSRGIVIHSVANTSNDWDTGFFIRLTESLPAGTRYRISFDYKASQNATANTQFHTEPGAYLTWEAFGSVNFTTEWQHFEYKGTLSPAYNPMRTFAFLLNVNKADIDYYFDNIVVELVDDHYYMVYDSDQDNKIEMTYNPSTMSYETTIAVEKDKEIWFEDDNGTPFNSLMDYDKITESNCTNLSVVSEGQKCNFTMGASGELTFALRETNNGLKLDVTGWPEREKIYLYAPSIVGWNTISAFEMPFNPETNAYEYEMDDANWMLIYLFSINPQSWNDINSENAYTVSGTTDEYKLSPNNNSVQLEKGPAFPIVANLPGNYKISIDADTKVLTLTGFNQYYYWTRGTSEVVGDVVEMTYNDETEEFEATLTVGDNESKSFYIADRLVGENDYQDHSYMRSIGELVPDNSTDIELEQIYYSNGMYIATPGTYKLCLSPRLMQLTVKGWTGTDISQLDNAIYSDKAQGCKGGSGTIAISLKNAQEAVAYQFDLKLPEGVTLKTDDNGDLIYRLSDRHNGHTVRYSYDENTDSYKFVVIAIPTKSLSDNDGIILTLGIDVADNVALGKYRFYIQNPLYTLNDGYRVNMNETTNLLSVDYYLLGDVNRDGDVDVSDVVCIVNHKIGKPNLDFVEEAADVDFDGEIDIADAVKLVNYIIKKISVLSHGVTGPVSISEPEPEFVPEPQ